MTNEIAGKPGEVRGYSWPMKLLHWLMAIIMIAVIAAGILMVNVFNTFNATTNFLYDLHRGLGFVLMILVIIRLMAYRFTIPPSPLPAHIPAWQRKAAAAIHFLLYAALLIHPLLGWIATNVWGVRHITVFGLFSLPTLAEKNRPLGEFLLTIHGLVGFLIAGLVTLHIAAALRHALIEKDGVFERMTSS